MARELHLTSGPIPPLLLRLAGPLLMSNLLQQIYNFINSMVVSRFLGEESFAALGVAESISNLYLFVLTGACLGASVLVARFYGEGNHAVLRQEIFVSGVLLGSFTLVLAAAGLIFLPQILALIHTPTELMPLVIEYLQILLVGTVFTFSYNFLAAVLRAVGNTRAALIFLFISLGYNLLAAWLLITRTGLGIRGPALATASAQLLSTALCLAYIIRRQPFLRPGRQDMRLDPALVRLTISFSSISALHQSSLYLGKLLIQSAVNDLGTAAISAFTAATRVEGFVQAIGSSSSETVAIFVAQNQGSGQPQRAKTGLWWAIAVVFSLGCVAGAVLILFPATLLSPFLAEGGGASMELGIAYLKALGPSYAPCLVGFTFVGYYRGSGRMNIPLMATSLQITLRVVFVWAMVGSTGLKGVAVATALSFTFCTMIHIVCYILEKKGIWVKKELLSKAWPTETR